MRIVYLYVCLVLLSSSSCEQAMNDDPPVESPMEELGTRALVTTEYSEEGCPILLEVEENGQKVLLMPIELEGKFKIHGTKVLIEYHLSRIVQSECQKGRPIVVEKIELTD